MHAQRFVRDWADFRASFFAHDLEDFVQRKLPLAVGSLRGKCVKDIGDTHRLGFERQFSVGQSKAVSAAIEFLMVCGCFVGERSKTRHEVQNLPRVIDMPAHLSELVVVQSAGFVENQIRDTKGIITSMISRSKVNPSIFRRASNASAATDTRNPFSC